MGRVRALFLPLAFFLLPLLACVRAAVAGCVPACECGGSSHGHMPGVSVVVVVVVVVDLALFSLAADHQAQAPDKGRNRHPLSLPRVYPPTSPSAAEWRRASQLFLCHHHHH